MICSRSRKVPESPWNRVPLGTAASPPPPPHLQARARLTFCSRSAISCCNGVSGLVISGGRCRHKAPNRRHGDRLPEGAASRDRRRERGLLAQRLSRRRQPLATPNRVRPMGAAIFPPSHKAPRLPARLPANPTFP